MNPIDCMEKLDTMAMELDSLSKGLAETERQLEPVEKEYTDFVDDFETSLWDRHRDDGEKLPAEAMRRKLARRGMKDELRGRHDALTAKRKRLEKRIATLVREVSAQQSILSALKVEAEATNSGMRRAA